MKNTIIRFDNTDIFVNDGMPGLMIHIQEDGKEMTRYLYPFRGYSFQVCGTRDGEGDLGRTEVVGLGNVYNATMRSTRAGWGYLSNVTWGTYECTTEILSSLAYKAVMKFSNRYAFITQDYDTDTLDNFALICTAWIAIKMNDYETINDIMDDWKYHWNYTDDMKQMILDMKK